MKLTSHTPRQLAAATAGPPASQARPAHPVIAYVTSFGNGTRGTVTPINAATNKAGKAIKVGANLGTLRSLRTGRPPTASAARTW
jgi:hypothetical protein